MELDFSRDNLFDELGLRRLKSSYMRDEETSPQERFKYVVEKFSSNEEHAKRMYEYVSKHYTSLSTPILSFGKSSKGLPISCFLAWLQDSSDGLINTLSEVNRLSMAGGGVGIGFGIRSEDEKSVGIMPHLKVYEASMMAYRQGRTRRGSYAAYLDIDHPNIVPFIEMRKPTGDVNMRCLELHHGVNISDKFMELIEACMLDDTLDDTWELKDPGSDVVKGTVSAKWLWELILTTRMRTGEPYIHYIDTSNKSLPEFQKKLGLSIRQSNICTEITLPTSEERTAVCCLLSFNLVYWDEWKNDYQFYKDNLEFLDNVLQYYIDNAPDYLSKSKYSAYRERSVGIGSLGFHALLQSKMIPFDSVLATSLNEQIYSRYKTNLDRANIELAKERGECPDAKGYGKRFSHLTSIAPNASSSLILGNTSPSVEPFRSNGYRQDTLGGMFMNKNKYLDEIIKDYCKKDESLKYDDIWSSIISNRGSCQHLDFLSDYEKDVFKTATEIDQRKIIELAANRQKYIDQAQSINLFFRPDTEISYLHHVHFQAWKKQLKTLYYCRSEKIYYGESMNKRIERFDHEKTFDKTTEAECLSCEG